ncbi:MMPL family transporter [Antrihabitans sp. YC2-6]|uniref:MMPL family transporter n=1 Tax=Antrihabitans sp. YC2-6 TaxID=2799498 RepID=UPI0018F653C7|nr:MMPL family transporter [Antrihabitans sp. YC2-6]MBJ8346712.1 MMPL family transporter [Antrihabitans sp. YC2-6]
MFLALGRIAFTFRYPSIVLAVLLMGGLGLYGMDFGNQLSQEGWFDDTSQSVAGSILADDTFGRDTDADVIALYTAPDGRRVDDPDIAAAAKAHFTQLRTDHPDEILRYDSFWDSSFAKDLADNDRRHAFASIGLAGDGGNETLANYEAIKDDLAIDGLRLQVAGLLPVADAMQSGMESDVGRAELIALPLVGLLLFFVFGSVVAAALPVFIGGLTILGAGGILRLVMLFTDVNVFASSVVTLIGLGLAIDYGLFTVSRFREEIAEGRTPDEAVRITVATAGRTIAFSASIIVTCLGGLLIFPHGILKSVAYGAISTIVLAAALSIVVLPAILGILGRRVDMLGLPFLRRTKTGAEIDAGTWSRLANWAMKRPWLLGVPITLLLLALVIPFKNVEFGGLSEKYLAADNPTRVAQETYDQLFPDRRTEPIRLVVAGADNKAAGEIRRAASRVSGLTDEFRVAEATKNGINVYKAGLDDRDNPHSVDDVITQLRAITPPDGVQVMIAGTPALERDSINGLIDRLPWLLGILLVASFVLMFLAFGSFVLPIKATLVSFLSLTATLGVVTWIFYEGHGAGLLEFTPSPLMFAVLILIVTIVFGLSTDYEIFLMSRMVERRAAGHDTPECIRYGIAHTGGIITAAALILIVVTGAFGLSEIVMMKYIAYGMIAALVLDATVIRMFLVPAIMRILGDACWWAPAWAKRLHVKFGLKEYA